MNAVGFIFSKLQNEAELCVTRSRTFAALPFACRYRLVDFPLSSMVNAGIININVIANYNYRSLIQHIGSGKDWDLARYTGGVHIMSPYQNAGPERPAVYKTHKDALLHMEEYIYSLKEEYMILADCNAVCNLDYQKILKFHQNNEAEVTVVASDRVKDSLTIPVNKQGRVTFTKDGEVERLSDLGVYVLSGETMRRWLSIAKTENHPDFTMDFIVRESEKKRIFVYRHTGYVAKIHSFEDYFLRSIELTEDAEMAMDLFGKSTHRILTRVHNSPPVHYGTEATVKNALIADGCIIEGTVENSVIFRNVKIGRGSVIKNSVLFADTEILENTCLDCVVADKRTKVGSGRVLSGHITMPVYIPKRREV